MRKCLINVVSFSGQWFILAADLNVCCLFDIFESMLVIWNEGLTELSMGFESNVYRTFFLGKIFIFTPQ